MQTSKKHVYKLFLPHIDPVEAQQKYYSPHSFRKRPGKKTVATDGGRIARIKHLIGKESLQILNEMGITERGMLNLQTIEDETILHILAKIIFSNETLASIISMLVLKKQGRYAVTAEEWIKHAKK